MSDNAEKSKKIKRIQPQSVKLQMAGELLLARSPDRNLAQLFRRYESLLECFANMDREERIINYKFLVGLILTSHAKKTQDIPKRKEIFDLKNALYFNLANNRNFRRKLAFKYLVSKNFRVLKFCNKCEEANSGTDLPRHQWKFCKDCDVDRKFFNVMSMHHKFDSGSSTLFLSNDLVHQIENLRLPKKGKLDDFKEEARYQKYHYNVKNLDIFELESVIKAQEKLLTITE